MLQLSLRRRRLARWQHWNPAVSCGCLNLNWSHCVLVILPEKQRNSAKLLKIGIGPQGLSVFFQFAAALSFVFSFCGADSHTNGNLYIAVESSWSCSEEKKFNFGGAFLGTKYTQCWNWWKSKQRIFSLVTFRTKVNWNANINVQTKTRSHPNLERNANTVTHTDVNWRTLEPFIFPETTSERIEWAVENADVPKMSGCFIVQRGNTVPVEDTSTHRDAARMKAPPETDIQFLFHEWKSQESARTRWRTELTFTSRISFLKHKTVCLFSSFLGKSAQVLFFLIEKCTTKQRRFVLSQQCVVAKEFFPSRETRNYYVCMGIYIVQQNIAFQNFNFWSTHTYSIEGNVHWWNWEKLPFWMTSNSESTFKNSECCFSLEAFQMQLSSLFFPFCASRKVSVRAVFSWTDGKLAKSGQYKEITQVSIWCSECQTVTLKEFACGKKFIFHPS